MQVAVTFSGCHRRGGVERVALECVNFLATRGHDVHAIARDWDADALTADVQRHPLQYSAHPRALALPRYRRAVTRQLERLAQSLDVVGGFGAGAPPGAVVWMQSVHASWIELSRRERNLRGRAKQALNPFHTIALEMERRQLVNREYAQLIALTPAVKSDIMRHYGVPERDIEILPNGYSACEFYPRPATERARQRARLGYSGDDIVIIFVANELERKGFAQLLEAVSRLGDDRLRVLAVGRFDRVAGARLAARYRLGERVKFVGSSSSVADYYASADIFALPTHYEAWGLVIIEAMACGLPVLTSSLAGAAAAVLPGINGYLVSDPSDLDELAGGLTALMDGNHADHSAIAASVSSYEWGKILVSYERILLACQR